MSKKRVHEVAKQMQKSNKEIIDFLQKNKIEVQSHMSAITEEQVTMVEKAFKNPEAKASQDDRQIKAASTEKVQESAPKKKMSVVYRPQNSSQRPSNYKNSSQAGSTFQKKTEEQPQRPQNASGQDTNQRPSGNISAQRSEGQSYNQGQRPENRNPNYQDRRPEGGNPNYQGQRPDNRTSNYQGQRPDNRTSNYQGQRPDNRTSNYQGQRPDNQTSNYQGQRPDNQNSNYQGQRSDNRTSNYQGQRPDNRNSNYQGQRPDNRTSNYQGQRPDNRTSNYQGQRPDNRNSNYQGQRPDNRNSNYQGQRPDNRNSNYQGQRPDNRTSNYQGQRPDNRNSNYQGQRPDNRGGYQGQRPDNRGGYGQRPDGRPGMNNQGQRNDNRSGGYSSQGQRNDGRGGYQGQRGQGSDNRGQRVGTDKPLFETPQGKPTSNRQSNKGKPVQKYVKKTNNDFEDTQQKSTKGKFIKPVKVEVQVEEIKNIIIPEHLTIKELADKMKIQPSVIVKKLFLAGKVVTLNQEINFDDAEEIALEFDITCEQEVKIDVLEELLKEEADAEETLASRPPVVCVMGHVDHGKTSLLDSIRRAKVAQKEAGGITQHIGAYVADCNGDKITFLDTPGHEAFTAMRMRGAKSTDIAILVVAADDGVMPQTIEAINHAKAADVEIIVAINKIDKPSANIDRVKQEMSEHELVPEDWGGSTIFVPVSAHTGEGIDTLLEMILLVSEVKELKANPNRNARGLVIEAELDKGKGPVATVLVQKGTLKVGDSIAAGSCYGKVRAMMDDKGRRLKSAGPSMPVEILGLNDVPSAGEVFVGTDNDKEARSFADTFITEGREKMLEDTKAKLSLDDLFSQIKSGNIKELNIIIKADVQGSVEAVKQSLVKLSNEEVMVKVIHGGVGAINESDVMLASASNAIIIGFNVRPDVSAKSVAESEKVDLRLYKVIYKAIEDVEAAMKGMLDPIFEEKIMGHAVVRQTFKASGIGTIAGAYVMDGKFQRGCSVRVTREGKQTFEGPLASLKRFKDDVKEVATGYECGLVFEKFNDIMEDDMVEAYMMVEVPR